LHTATAILGKTRFSPDGSLIAHSGGAMSDKVDELASDVDDAMTSVDELKNDPGGAARIKDPGVERSRDRVLDDDEIRELWKVLEQLAKPETGEPLEVETENGPKRIRRLITPPTAQAFQVQLLTAQ
jgi:hypothetical protein